MRKFLIVLASLAIAGCMATEICEETIIVHNDFPTYTACFEEESTKVYVDSDLKLHWNAGDEISIFRTTGNQMYVFDGATGDREGTFSTQGDPQGGSKLQRTYAVYPYSDDTSINSDGVITLNLPSVQHFAENSFGPGASTMVAVTESKKSDRLSFKNLCGYLVVKLYGEGTIKSITLTGNNGEKLSGLATVIPVFGEAPILTMSESAGTSITLDCGEGAALGKTADDATSFWFAVPPVTFTQGFTIRVTNIDGYTFEKETKTERTATRCIKYSLSPLYASFDLAPDDSIAFTDPSFKSFCLSNFDSNKDGEISYSEALSVSTISCDNHSISSLEEIRFFPNLTSLSCMSNNLTQLDVSKNVKLTTLKCSYNQLTSIDLTNNTLLEDLRCTSNELLSLNLSSCPRLTILQCANNNLKVLDVSNNPALKTIVCTSNQLSSLDVVHNTALTSLSCAKNKIQNIDISNCPKLLTLTCYNNLLTSLSVSNNTNLSSLSCYSNSLTYLDITNNESLNTLYCNDNQISSLSIGNNTILTKLNCASNGISELSLVSCPKLESLLCQSNSITSLDVSNNQKLKELRCLDNPNLHEIWLQAGQRISAMEYDKELTIIKYTGNIPFFDDIFKAYCVQLFDSNADGELSCKEAESIIDINCNNLGISSLNGMQYFPNLESLSCENNNLTRIDLEKNTNLRILLCDNNQLNELTIGVNTLLETIRCSSNKLKVLDVVNNVRLNQLHCNNNPYLTEIWLGEGQSITDFIYDSNIATVLFNGIVEFEDTSFKEFCLNNYDEDKDKEISYREAALVTSLTIKNSNSTINSLKGLERFINLVSFSCSGYLLQLNELDVSPNKSIQQLMCQGNNIKRLKASGCDKLSSIDCSFCYLEELDVANCSSLKTLTCNSNHLSSISIDGCTSISEIDCSTNQLTDIDFSNTKTLVTLLASTNWHLASIDVSGCESLYTLKCDNCALKQLIVQGCSSMNRIECYANGLESLDVSSCPHLVALDCVKNALTSLNVEGCSELWNLYCTDNQLESIDVNSCTGLSFFKCGNNKLSSLNLNNNIELRQVSCEKNRLSEIDVSHQSYLTRLYCYSNNITAVDVTNNPALYLLSCGDNSISTLDLSKNIEAFTYLFCANNKITSLDISHNEALQEIECNDNLLESLDVSNNPKLYYLHAHNNPNLIEIWLKTGQSIRNFTYDTDIATIRYKD